MKNSLNRSCVAGFSTIRASLTSWLKLIHRGVCLGTDIPTRAPLAQSPLPSRVSYEDGLQSQALSGNVRGFGRKSLCSGDLPVGMKGQVHGLPVGTESVLLPTSSSYGV